MSEFLQRRAWIWGWPILRHEQLEELCFLAATGEVREAEWEMVRAHLGECRSCRNSFSDLGTIHSVCFTQAPGFEVERAENAEDRLRNSILRAASREGAQFSGHVTPKTQHENRQSGDVDRFSVIRCWAIGASLVGICGCVVLGFAVRRSQRVRMRVASAVTQAVIPSTIQNSNLPTIDDSRRKGEILEQEVAALKAERSRIEQGLRRAENESRELQGAASGMKEQIATLTAELQATRATLTRAEEALQQLKSERDSDQAAMQAQNREIRSLNERLEEQSSEKERDQNVLVAETKLRELVGARNLHIVDVYDTDPNGKTKKAVGRVFYTQGQSLVFYAYDLSTNRSETGKYSYYVWGHKEGKDESVRNLGTLDPDDVSQKRWMLKVNDARALSNIDRVFVTLEQDGKLDLRPHGKKILSAYLGSPVNHP